MNEQRYREAEHALWQSKGASPTERFVSIEPSGTRVRVLELGEGPPVLFVHGGNISGASWASLAAGMTGFRCIIPDRPGCGLSETLAAPLTSATLPQHAENFIPGLLDALGIETADVIATSFGAYLSLHSAASHPDRIGKMVLFGWPFGESSSLPAFMRMMSVPGVARLMTAMPVNERAVRMMFRSIGHGPTLKAGRLTPGDLRWCKSLMRDTGTLRNEVAPVMSWISPRRGLRPDLALTDAMLASVGTPTRLLWGENDPFGGPEVARRFVQRLPHAELELIPNAGHAPWLDELALCLERTRQFLVRTPVAPAVV